MEAINAFQRTALKVYAEGDFDHLKTYDYKDEYGDSLLSFVLAELSDNEDCESLDMAIDRIQSGIDDLQAVLAALQATKE
jgi:hypothetical protein